MNFLLNMNISRKLGRLLEEHGHQWRHVSDEGLSEAEDRTLVEIAKASGEVIVTHDLDYGQLLAFSGDIRPSVIIFRRRNMLAEALVEKLTQNWAELSVALEQGALVILEDTAIRVRRLPIGRS